MTGIYLDGHMTIRKFSSTGTGVRNVVKVEIEVTDPYSLGHLLRELADAQRKTELLRPRRKPSAASAADQKRLTGSGGQMLALPYFGGDEP